MRSPGKSFDDRQTHVRSALARARWLTFALIWLAAVLVARAPAPAQVNRTTEYQVKAAFLLNFIQFIEWPSDAFGDANGPIVVGVLGDDPFGEILEQTFRNEIVQEKGLRVVRSQHVEDLAGCHLLFVSRSERARVGEIIAELRSRPVVTVSEISGFARRGGVINFYVDGNKIRFEINADAAEKKGVRISSQLLKRSRVVGSE